MGADSLRHAAPAVCLRHENGRLVPGRFSFYHAVAALQLGCAHHPITPFRG